MVAEIIGIFTTDQMATRRPKMVRALFAKMVYGGGTTFPANTIAATGQMERMS